MATSSRSKKPVVDKTAETKALRAAARKARTTATVEETPATLESAPVETPPTAIAEPKRKRTSRPRKPARRLVIVAKPLTDLVLTAKIVMEPDAAEYFFRGDKFHNPFACHLRGPEGYLSSGVPFLKEIVDDIGRLLTLEEVMELAGLDGEETKFCEIAPYVDGKPVEFRPVIAAVLDREYIAAIKAAKGVLGVDPQLRQTKLVEGNFLSVYPMGQDPIRACVSGAPFCKVRATGVWQPSSTSFSAIRFVDHELHELKGGSDFFEYEMGSYGRCDVFDAEIRTSRERRNETTQHLRVENSRANKSAMGQNLGALLKKANLKIEEPVS